VSTITLTTDFGTGDWFVGTLKGVILGINPRATIVDITHEIPPGDIRGGAFALAASFRFFPAGTIHVAVVDPGVGSRRKAIGVQTANYFFVGPDNGVLSWALAKEKVNEVRALENKEYFLHPVSRTFHGRDIFAPVAAHLSRAVRMRKFGTMLKEFLRLPCPEPRRRKDGRIEGEVIYVDRFGNAITNIDASILADVKNASGKVLVGGKCICSTGGFYDSVARGKPVAVLGSSGFLEISINGGSAAKRFGLRPGTSVVVHL